MTLTHFMQRHADTGFSKGGGGGVVVVMDISYLDIFLWDISYLRGLTAGGQNAAQIYKGGQNAGHFGAKNILW